MSKRPSWWPGDEEIDRVLDVIRTRRPLRPMPEDLREPIRSLAERVALKAQIEEAEYQHNQSLGGGFATEERVLELRARLAELEGR